MASKKSKKKGTTIEVIDRATGKVDKKATQKLRENNALFNALYENEQTILGRLSNRAVAAGTDILSGIGTLANIGTSRTIKKGLPISRLRRHAKKINERVGKPTTFSTSVMAERIKSRKQQVDDRLIELLSKTTDKNLSGFDDENKNTDENTKASE
jgi:hypothetical protein